MKKPNSQFDAEMLIIADREISPKNPLITSLITSEKGDKTIIGPLVLELLSLLEEIKTMAGRGKINQFNQRNILIKQLKANIIIEVLREQKLINKEILEILIDGKVKVGMWLDSIGGAVDQEEKVKYSLDYLTRNNASVNAYVGIKAISAAFDLAFLADELNSLSRSVFMWHFSDYPEFRREDKVKQLLSGEECHPEVEEEIGDLMMILNSADERYRAYLLDEFSRQIASKNNPSGAVYFDGDMLYDCGLVHRCSRNIDRLIEQFKKDFPAHADTNLSLFTTEIAKKAYKNIEELPDWSNSIAVGTTDRIRRRYEKSPQEISITQKIKNISDREN